MAACNSLRSLFETPLPEKPTLMESLNWSQKKHSKPMEHSVTELFGELHFQEKPDSGEDKHGRNCNNPLDTLFHSGKDNNYKSNMSMDSYKSTDQKHPKPMEQPTINEIFGELHFQEKSHPKPMERPTINEIFGELHFQEKSQSTEESRCRKSESIIDSLFKQNKHPTLDSLLGAGKNSYLDSKSSVNFSHKNSESLQKCTEGLGSESSDDVDDLVSESDYDWKSDDQGKEKEGCNVSSSSTDKRVKIGGGGRGFPPPISSIGRSGKPRVCFKSYREGGRFVLKEIRIPNHELLSASRHDGRLKLQFVQPELDIAEEEEEQTEEERPECESNVDNNEIGGGKE